MAKRQEIEFIIRPDGSVEERVTGVEGPNCQAITDAIEKALGMVARRSHTADYYQQPETSGDTLTTQS